MFAICRRAFTTWWRRERADLVYVGRVVAGTVCRSGRAGPAGRGGRYAVDVGPNDAFSVSVQLAQKGRGW